MRVKSKVLIGLIVLICLVSGVSIVKRIGEEKDMWRSADIHSSLGVNRRSTFSVVSGGSNISSDDVALSIGAGSMPGRSARFSYARAMSSPVSGSAYSQSPIAYSQRLHTTSSAEVRSFGGGGNGGGVSMSGGQVKSTGSSVSSSSILNVSMPNNTLYALSGQSASSEIPVVSGDLAVASTVTNSSAYSGIGYISGGTSRGLGGKKVAPGLGGGWWTWFDSWVSENGDGYSTGEEGSYIFDRYALESAYNDFIASYWNSGMGDAPSFAEWLDWYLQAMSDGDGSHKYEDHTYYWQPVGDIWPLLVMLLMYAGYVVLHRRKAATTQND